ncbi:MAG TPA: right-handed parallel beta-helix repeat-containing protein [Gaiellaceae bacterium]|nr:right-handed parallel beta-helix repeat-containing protein [Gaiellaceae bacterium]
MSYTLRGRVDSRLAALLPVLLLCCVLAGVLRHWWPVELCGLMAAVGVAFDLQVWHRLLPYQPAWAAVPLGLAELGALMAVVYAFGLHAPLWPALALFAGGWLLSVVLGQAAYPLLRLGYAEDGGELGRAGAVAAAAVALAFAGSGATWAARLPPVVHLSAGVHQGPLVIDRREVLVGDRGAVVRGGIVVRHDDVKLQDLTVVGGLNGITIEHVRNTRIQNVTISRAREDGIHVRFAGVSVMGCAIDMTGNPYGQGIDVSYTMGYGMTMIEGCTVTGGQEGIVTHSAMADIMGNRVSRTTLRGISMTEMSMGKLDRNQVTDALGIGLYCNDHSLCDVRRNVVVGTRADRSANDRARAGVGLVVSYDSEAEVRDNELAANPVQTRSVYLSTISQR